MAENANLTVLANDMSDTVTMPIMDALPHFVPDPDTLLANHIVGFGQDDTSARPFKILRTQVGKKLEANGWQLIGVTSATPGAGKSFLSLNLAASLAQIPERQVYLFDLDFRNPSIGKALGMEPSAGLGRYLEGSVSDLSAVGYRVGTGNLAVFPSLARRANSAELIASERFAELVAAMRKLPDTATVIFDLPPVFANDDTMIAMQSLDTYALVVDQGVTTAAQIRDAMRLLEPAPLLGTVLNRYSGTMLDQYGYGYYGAYGSTDGS